MRSTLTRPGIRLRRTAAGAITTALAATSLALVPGTAQADPVAAPSLTWKISQQFVDHLSTRTLADGATFDASTGFTFGDGVGYFDSGNGAASIAYKGSVKGAFINAGTEYYSVTVADPIVAVDSAGEGTISAVVSATNAAQGPTPAASTTPARVVVTTFDAATSDWTTSAGLKSLTDTPDWTGVLPAGSAEAVALGITNPAQPLNGSSFAPTFLGQLTSGVRAHFYDTTSVNVKKPAASFTATAAAPAVTATTASTTPGDGLVLNIVGSGFSKTTNPGDAGVYVGLGESGGMPDVSLPSNISLFAAAVPVWSSAIGADGAFTTSLTAATEKLDPTKSYSLYTWRAHTHSTTSQDTETPVTIDFSKLVKYASTPVVAAAATTAYGKAVTVTATVPTLNGIAPTGNVVLTGAGTQTKALAGGKATFTLPANLSVAKRNLTVTYQGDDNYAAKSTVKAVTVAKDSVTISDKVTKKPTTKKSGKATITVKAKSSKIKPTGKVTVYFKKSGQKSVKASTGTLKNGVKSITVPKLKKKGTWKIYVSYSAGSGYNSVSSKYVGTVKVTK